MSDPDMHLAEQFDADEPDWDEDVCPRCGSKRTLRYEIIAHDPDVWFCGCADCDYGFEVLAAKDAS